MLAPDFLPSVWGPDKVAAFKAAFYEFLKHVRINSKEKGGNYRLADGVYEAQRRFLDAIFDALAEDVHDIKILKSRQLGCSTISRALVVFYVGIFPGLQGACILDTDKHMQSGRKEIEWLLDHLPASLGFPRIKDRNRNGITLWNGSSLQFLAAGVRSSRGGGTLSRGDGFNLLWCSEVCSWENDEGIKTLKSSLAKDYPDRLYIWESTARGFNAWHDMWLEAQGDDLNQRTMFIGWWAKENQRLRRGSAAFAKYGEAPPDDVEEKRIAAVRELYAFSVDAEQLAWYRQLVDPTREREAGDPDDSLLLQDQPWTEEEAFQQSGSTFFDPEVLSAASAKVPSFKPQGFKFYPATEFVHSDFRLARTYRDIELRVWEEPEAEACYVIAGDPAFGHDETNDRSACQVLKCYADGIEQVAEYASASAPAHQFAWLIAGLVGWYAQGGRAQVLVIIELNGPGEAVWREYSGLRQIVSNGYLRKEAAEKGLRDVFNNVRNYVYARSDSMTGGHNYHFKTNQQLKVAIMERLRDFTHSGKLLVRSMDTIEEMKAITRAGDTIKGEGKKKDDRVFAMALGCRAWEEKFRRGLIAGNRTKEADIARKRLSYEDRYKVFTRSTLDMFFKSKERDRMALSRQATRNGWRYR